MLTKTESYYIANQQSMCYATPPYSPTSGKSQVSSKYSVMLALYSQISSESLKDVVTYDFTQKLYPIYSHSIVSQKYPMSRITVELILPTKKLKKTLNPVYKELISKYA